MQIWSLVLLVPTVLVSAFLSGLAYAIGRYSDQWDLKEARTVYDAEHELMKVVPAEIPAREPRWVITMEVATFIQAMLVVVNTIDPVSNAWLGVLGVFAVVIATFVVLYRGYRLAEDERRKANKRSHDGVNVTPVRLDLPTGASR